MNQDVIQLPIDGTLDLHTFLPGEVAALLPAYLKACNDKGIYEVRIVHGKGTGNLRRTVHSILARLDLVAFFQPAGEERGGWGATVVVLKQR